MLSFKHESTFDTSVPTCLNSPGPVYLKCHIRTSKYGPVVDKVDVLHATQKHALVRLPNRRETTILLKDIARYISIDSNGITDIDNANKESENVIVNLNDFTYDLNVQNQNNERDDRKKINQKESSNTNSNVAPVPRSRQRGRVVNALD